MTTRVEPAASVRIAVPAYTGLSDDTRRSIISGAAALKAEGIEFQDIDMLSSCYIDYSRNLLVGRFLASPATDLIFIDSDVGFEPAELIRLCRSTRPVVAGVYPRKTEPLEWPIASAPAGEEIWSDRDGLIECEWVPTGFLRINRAVFEALDVPTFGDREGAPVGAYFMCAVRDGRYWGEDVEFCRLVREAGLPVKAFAHMNLRHIGKDMHGNDITYSGNWGDSLREQMRMAA